MKTRIILILVITALSALSLYLAYNNKQQKEILESQVTSLKLEKQRSDSIINKQGQTIYTQETIITKDQESIKQLAQEKFNLGKKYEKQVKEVIAYYSSKTNTIVKNVPVPFVDTVARKKFSDSLEAVCVEVINYYKNNSVEVPVKVGVDDSSLSFHGTVNITGFKIDSLSIPDSTYLRFDQIKGGFLKRDFNGKRHLFTKKSVQIKVLHTSPYVKVVGQNSVIYQPKVKKNIIVGALLFVAGVLVGSQ